MFKYLCMYMCVWIAKIAKVGNTGFLQKGNVTSTICWKMGKCTLSIGVTKTQNRGKYALLLQRFCLCFFRLLSLRKFERWYAKKI